MDMNDYMERSTVLVEALPYIQKYYGKTIVIKYGGNAMISEELRSAVISDIILLHLVGVKVVMEQDDAKDRQAVPLRGRPALHR